MTTEPNPPCGQPGHLREAVRDHDGPADSYVACCAPSPNRWAAFTDDELDYLEDGMTEVAARIGGPVSQPEWVLCDEIRAEIERRKGEA